MTTRARKYRLKKGDALAEGVEAVSLAQDARGRPVAPSYAGEVVHPPADAMWSDASGASGPEARSGEVTSPQDIASQTEISTIRKEGLTGRQLRLARRLAQRHGLAVTSDFDAVRQLRGRGIDPFQRAAMLELVPGSGQADAKMGAIQLPQTMLRSHPPALSEPEPPEPVDRTGEILKIQKDIARRRRRKMLLLLSRLCIFVFLPTAIAGWYYARLATPMYATESEFVIQQADSASSTGIGGLFGGTGLAVQQDSTTVQSYLQSRDAMLRLDEDMGFKSHFQQERIDPIQRLPADASNEAAYRLYSRHLKVGYDPTEGILKMEVVAADPQTSQQFSEALIGYAEEQVDTLTQRLRIDQMAGAQESYEAAESNVREAQQKVLQLQEKLGVLDPVTESGALIQQISTFEVQLYEKQLQLEQLMSNARPNEARASGVKGDIARLEALIESLRDSMTTSTTGEASLARVTGQLRIAEADLTIRQLLLQQAAQQLEMARIEANRQVRYMAIGVAPMAQDEPTYPKAVKNTLLAFLIFAGIYLMISLTVSVLREQVSA